MNATIVNPSYSISTDAVSSSVSLERLRDVQRRMLARIATEPSHEQALQGIAETLRVCVEPLAMFYFSRDAEGQLGKGRQLLAENCEGSEARLARQLRAAVADACRTGQPFIRQQAAPRRLIVAVPVARRGADPEALAAAFPEAATAELLLMLMQMAASHLMFWHVLHQGRRSEAEAGDAAALLELLLKIENATDLRHATYTCVNELQAFLGVRRVAIGLRRRGKGRCQLRAVSGIARFDSRAVSANAIEAAFAEAVLRDSVTTWPASDAQPDSPALALRKLCLQEEATWAIGLPLRDSEGNAVAALVVLGDAPASPSEQTHSFLRAAERPLAASLTVMQRLEGGPALRWGRATGRLLQTGKGKSALAAALVAVLAMAVPVPHKVHCDCLIEPVTRRFVTAPFEGTLERALVKPGDVVSAGEVLARLDGREVRWKRAGLVADHHQARKRRDQSMATHKSAESQIARLEMERLDAELQLLDHRAEHLEIKSPVTGIVTSGDLERAEGAPLVIGQTLFEIAPLEQMIVEVAIPDEDVAYVRQGLPVAIRLDAYPGTTWQLQLERIEPRAEIRDQQNVFIAEATLDNTKQQLRPGMKGRAQVVGPRRPLGWILFHRPLEYLVKTLNW